MKNLDLIYTYFYKIVKAVFALLVVVLLSTNLVKAQVSVDNTITVKDLVENYLIGGPSAGIEVFNITFNGVPADNLVTQQMGQFSGGQGIFQINNGIMLATGDATLAEENNTSDNAGTDIGGFYFDSDLAGIATASINNAAVLEFDFIPTGTQLQFGYSFVSEEYNEFVFSTFNDVFGFWLTLPDGSKSNVAIAPDGNPVAINNVNNSLNSGNYQSNDRDDDFPLPFPNFQYDGFTIGLSVTASVVCGDTNHIKLAICDVGDGIYDSGIFLEGNFRSNIAINMDLEIFTNGDSTILYEECGEGQLIFTRPVDIGSDAMMYLEFNGTATNGVDYTLIPDSLLFPAGDSIIYYGISSIPDDIIEGLEVAAIRLVYGVSFCGETDVPSNEMFAIQEAPIIEMNTFDTIIGCGDQVTLDPQPYNGYGDYNFIWSTGETDSAITVGGTGTYFVTVGDSCGVVSVVDSFTVSNGNPPLIADPGLNDTVQSCLDTVYLNGVVSGGDGTYTYYWVIGNDTIFNQLNGIEVSNVTQNLTYELVAIDGCGAKTTNDVMVVLDPPPLEIDAGDSLIAYNCFDPNFLSGEIIEPGIGQYDTIEWINNNSGEVFEESLFLAVKVSETTNFTLRLVDVCGIEVIDSVTIYYEPPPLLLEVVADTFAISCVDTLILGASSTGGTGNNSYEWYNNGTLITTDSVFSIAVSQPQTFEVFVVDQCGQNEMDVVNINFIPDPVVLEIDRVGDICFGQELVYTALPAGGANPYLYQWNNGPETEINTLSFTADSSTFFSLSVSDFCGTQVDTSISFEVEHPIAIADYAYTDQVLTIQLSNLSSPDLLNYLWDFGDNTTSIEFEPNHLYNDYDDHLIVLTVSTDRGCIDEVILDYKAPSNVFIPNAFSPDGDGYNEYISVKGDNIKTVKMQIFDRWGQQVYQLNSTEDRWYGNHQSKNGDLTSSVYNYVVEWTDNRGNSFNKSGSILLIR